ncbi:MAG: MFS transporter [Bacteroidota bacterium]
MNREKLLLFTLALVQFTHIIDFMIIMPLGKQFMEIFDISPQQFSWIVACYAFSAFLTGILSAMFIDRFDRKKALLFVYVGFTIGTFCCAAADSYYLFLAARSLTGAFGGVLGALVFAIVADAVPYERRASAMGIVMTAFSVASVVGVPAGIYLAATFNWRAPFLVTALVSTVVALLIWRSTPSLTGHLDGQANTSNSLGNLVRIGTDANQVTALLFTLILILGHFTIIPFIAPYMQLNIGFSDYEVTFIYLIGGILSAFLLPLVGKLADRFGNIHIFTLASIGALFSIFAITNLPVVTKVIALCVTSSFFIVASGRSVPAMTMVTAVVKPEQRGSFMSIRSSINELGLALSSFIAGLIVVEQPNGNLANYQYVGYIAIFMSVVAVLFARRLRVIN